MGITKFWTYLLKEQLGIEIYSSVNLFLENREYQHAYDQEYKRRLDVKSHRIRNYIKNLKDEIDKQKRDKMRGATYLGRGGGFDNSSNNTTNKSKTNKQKRPRKRPPLNLSHKCNACQGLGHKIASSYLCDNKPINKNAICGYCFKVGHVN